MRMYEYPSTTYMGIHGEITWYDYQDCGNHSKNGFSNSASKHAIYNDVSMYIYICNVDGTENGTSSNWNLQPPNPWLTRNSENMSAPPTSMTWWWRWWCSISDLPSGCRLCTCGSCSCGSLYHKPSIHCLKLSKQFGSYCSCSCSSSWTRRRSSVVFSCQCI